MEIRGSKILVTGASGGLGQAIAVELAGRGADVVLSGRRRDQLEELAKRTGGEVLVADLCDREEVAAVADQVRSFDALVLNAGIGADPVLSEVTPDAVDRVIDTNLRAPIHLAIAFAQHHVATGAKGQLVMIGSLSGLAPSPNSRMYNATKFGLRGFTLALRQDLEGSGVGVTHVAPGFIRDAGMFAGSGIDLPPGVRTRTPADVASGVVRAIESDPAEVFVAPPELRLGATFATVAPAISARIMSAAGAAERKAAGSSGDAGA